VTPGIWRYAHLFADGGAAARAAQEHSWTLGEGDTRLQGWPELAGHLGLASLGLKREDHNPGRSHKDRGLLYQVARHRALAGTTSTHVISSSGNAAISAAAACGVTGDRLLAFVSADTAPAKRERLAGSGAVVIPSARPINFARYAARVFGLVNLRGTADASAPIGYRALAAEIVQQSPDVESVLTFASSGTSARGLLDGFEALSRPVAVWAVQAGVCLGIARATQPELADEPDNPAGRLGIRNPPQAGSIASALQASGGGATVVRRPELETMADRMDAYGLRTSAEGAAVLAGVAQLAPGPLAGRSVVAVITGDAEQWARHSSSPEPSGDAEGLVGSYLELRDLLIELGLEPV
jgi:threonine dehydratase